MTARRDASATDKLVVDKPGEDGSPGPIAKKPRVSYRGRKQKGYIFERQIAESLNGKRVPMSGALSHLSKDLSEDVVLRNGLRIQCKRLRTGWKSLYKLLETADIVTVRSDNQEPLIVMPLWKFQELVGEVLELPEKAFSDDLTGRRFGRWTVLSLGEPAKDGATCWNCLCECGTNRLVRQANLLRSLSLSCGCYVKDSASARSGPLSSNWKGGRSLGKDGYIRLASADMPDGTVAKAIPEHIVVMSWHLGRRLHDGENVHHRNGFRDDNRIENLELWTTQQPSGQRVTDLVEWAKEILNTYEFDLEKAQDGK